MPSRAVHLAHGAANSPEVHGSRAFYTRGAGRRASIPRRRAQDKKFSLVMTKDRGAQAINQRTCTLEPRSLGLGQPALGQRRTLISWK